MVHTLSAIDTALQQDNKLNKFAIQKVQASISEIKALSPQKKLNFIVTTVKDMPISRKAKCALVGEFLKEHKSTN